MKNQTVSTNQNLTLRVDGKNITERIGLLADAIDKPRGIGGRFQSALPYVAQINVGYTVKILGEERDCYLVETYSGKVGFILKELLVPASSYKLQDSYPRGKQVIRSKLVSSYSIFAVDSERTDGIFVYEKADGKTSRPLFVLAPLEAVSIVETLNWYYKVVLPGPSQGFVYRNHGVRRDWAPKAESHFGFCGVRKGEAGQLPIRYVPDDQSESIMDLNSSFRLPVVEEWDNWFRVQLPDGSLGFVSEKLSMRTLTAETLVSKPSAGSGNVIAGLLGVAGLLALGTVGGALKDE